MTWPTKTDFVDGDVLTAAQVNNIGTNLNLADPTGITDGYVLTADGAGSMAWEQVAAGGMTSLATGTLSGSVVTLSSISSGYNDLVLDLYGITCTSNPSPEITVNNSNSDYVGVGQANVNNVRTEQNNTYFAAQASFSAFLATGGLNSTRFVIPNYNNAANRCLIIVNTAFQNTGSNYAVQQVTYNKRNLGAAVNRLDIFSAVGNFNGGTYRLWGVK
jgi:hypothetical protein